MENTMLLLAVFDQDVIKDDFAGVCVVPCKDIPRLGADDEQRSILEVDAPERKVSDCPFPSSKCITHPSRAGIQSWSQ